MRRTSSWLRAQTWGEGFEAAEALVQQGPVSQEARLAKGFAWRSPALMKFARTVREAGGLRETNAALQAKLQALTERFDPMCFSRARPRASDRKVLVEVWAKMPNPGSRSRGLSRERMLKARIWTHARKTNETSTRNVLRGMSHFPKVLFMRSLGFAACAEGKSHSTNIMWG